MRAHLCADESRCNILQLQNSQGGQLLVDALEHMVVNVPSLMQLSLLPGLPKLLGAFICVIQLPPIVLHTTHSHQIFGSAHHEPADLTAFSTASACDCTPTHVMHGSLEQLSMQIHDMQIIIV